MSLWIGTNDDESSFIPVGDPGIDLDDDPYYWFLYPHFEDIFRQTEQLIDLYGDAAFSGRDLIVLRNKIQHVRADSEQLDEKVQVTTESKIWIDGRFTYPELEKSKLLGLLDSFLETINFAIKNNYRVVCFGD